MVVDDHNMPSVLHLLSHPARDEEKLLLLRITLSKIPPREIIMSFATDPPKTLLKVRE